MKALWVAPVVVLLYGCGGKDPKMPTQSRNDKITFLDFQTMTIGIDPTVPKTYNGYTQCIRLQVVDSVTGEALSHEDPIWVAWDNQLAGHCQQGCPGEPTHGNECSENISDEYDIGSI